MEQNHYKTPEASLIDEKKFKFYVVAPKKFLALFLGTVGAYGTYWLYKNWAQYRAVTGKKVYPIARAIFSIFFVHELFNLINLDIKEKAKSNWHTILATLFVVTALFNNLADKLIEESFGELTSILISMGLIFVDAWVLYQVQLKINLACESPSGEANRDITPLNILWIVMGMLLWGIFIYAILLTFDIDLLEKFEML